MATNHGPFNLASTYLRLRPDAPAEPLTVDASFWAQVSSGKLGTFHNEYLVASNSADSDWTMWEMHPNGDEIVCLLEGAVTFVLEIGGAEQRVALEESGSYVIVPKGTWHTVEVARPSRLLFITPGEGTQHRSPARSVE